MSTKTNLKDNASFLSAIISYLIGLYNLHTQGGISKEVLRFIKFCLVGLIGVGVSVGSLWMLTEVAGLFYIISASFAHILSVTSNFTWNQVWTFRDRRDGDRLYDIFRRWLRFLLSTSVALVVYISVLTLLTEVIGLYYIVSALCAIALATPVNFLLSTFWVWKLSRRKSKSSS